MTTKTISGVREPRQQRSRETLDRLLAATVKALDEEGLDGAVVPRIAALAGVAPASIYRRFPDKDALLREAFLHMLRASNTANRDHLSKMLVRDTLEASAAQLMELLFAQYRRHPRLMRSLLRFLENEGASEFAREVHGHIAQNMAQVVDVLQVFKAEIPHRVPRRALQFAVLSAAGAIESFALEPVSLWQTVLPMSDRQFQAEQARSFVAYLRMA
ncbi:TetR/AcrR family transcriptional regulator [Dyella sp. ASV21]|uniref:TetR/AcrR family transcriptional regulator n=1 Tax=Dyella sp. ASV21 TaxID=2795114 RepID=UPI0018ECFF1A|nr:TetR/AcrR family transcriptional regulator [Dyella sp. ASV21]